ncbi:MAG: hypothetical protein NC248_11400 [Bacteroides sp.]|nr:hypothetical protein [Bacteroides sp.]MCM1391042.1 hypothetical protein [Bacteroides sp.]
MPHKDGKVYQEIRNGKPYGISHQDIAAVLGSVKTDLGTLCLHPAINMWAMFKPQRVDQMEPLTNQQRKDTQYGLTVTVGDAAGSPLRGDGTAPKWTYGRLLATDWFRQDDFCGDNPETEGYARNAPPVAEAELVEKKFVFRFTGNETNGGIRPEQFLVSGLGKTISELYPGICIYRYTDTGCHPAWIATADKKVGVSTNEYFEKERTLFNINYADYMGTGVMFFFPMLSPEPHFGGGSLSSVRHKVLFLHNVMFQMEKWDEVVGTELLTRKVVNTGYYSFSPAQPTNPLVLGLGGASDYLQLTPTKELQLLADKDKRIMVNMDFNKNYNNYGFGSWCPINDDNLVTSKQSFNEKKKTYAYVLCRWQDFDGEEVALVLRYIPVAGEWKDASSLQNADWYVRFRRELAFIANGRELWATNSYSVSPGTVTDNDITVEGTPLGVKNISGKPLTRVRFGNIVNANPGTAKGLYFAMRFGESGKFTETHHKEEGDNIGLYTIDSSDSTKGALYFNSVPEDLKNVTNSTGTNRLYTIEKIRVPTSVDLDISVDTAETQDESLNWINA